MMVQEEVRSMDTFAHGAFSHRVRTGKCAGEKRLINAVVLSPVGIELGYETVRQVGDC